MKISLITICFNSALTIEDTFKSVLGQTYFDIEYIVVDGLSKDNTVEIIQKYEGLFQGRLKWISEKDKGLYDAMNKGIQMASGEVIGILNSDDFFYDGDVVKKVSTAFLDPSVDATIGDIVFIKDQDHSKVIRKYGAKKWRPSKFAWGYMPPHPSFFVRKEFFDHLGYYKLDYKIAADYELLIRFLLKGKLRWKYLPIVTTKMRMGGASTSGLKSLVILNDEIIKGCNENDVYTNKLMVYSKYLFKPFEFLVK